MRYFLELEYFGKAYHGWQRQPTALSVQEVVEESLRILLQEKVEIVGAGRTDSGVHARQIYAHVDTETELENEFIFRINSLLPKDISVKNLHRVTPEAHARFDAVSRSYEYHIVVRKDVFRTDRAYYLQKKLDVEKMGQAAEILLQYTNFKCFSRSRTDVFTYNCKIERAEWEQQEDRLIFHVTADRFLRNMVRAIVGTLIQVGLGKIGVEEMHRIIKSEDRSKAGASVPAHGLYLTEIIYPKSIFI